MALLCGNCRRVLPGGVSTCPTCGGQSFYCGDCRQWLPPGTAACSCSRAVLVSSCPSGLQERSAPSDHSLAISVTPVAPVVLERRSAGRFGVEAEVTVPAGDVAILNELGALVAVLHQVAGRLGQLSVGSDHTRKLMRDMRVLAADAIEEIEMRQGPVG